jgi:hypothetical protein
MKVHHRLVFPFSILFAALAGCASASRDRSNDIARLLVGKWTYDDSDPDCRSIAYQEYSANGTYSETSENCGLVSDGFGHFHFGWYVAENHVCFVNVEEEFSDQVKRPAFYRERFQEMVKSGFVAERCPWFVESVTPRTMTVQVRGESPRTVTLKRGY